MKILSIIGTRPQFIKVSALEKAVPDSIEHEIIDTGQHYDYVLAGKFIEDLGIRTPKWNLETYENRESIQIAKMLIGIQEVLDSYHPDHIVVYGDTNSTLAGAISSIKNKIPFSHVESGLRSRNLDMSEEQNRIIADHMANLRFCTNTSSIKTLISEGLSNNNYLVGDLAMETFKSVAATIEDTAITEKFLLATIHRPSNTDNPLRLQEIMNKLGKSSLKIRLYAHPRLLSRLNEFDIKIPNIIEMHEPAGYRDFILNMKSSTGIITDSGGVQKESYSLGIPTLTIRKETEWFETLEGGWNILDSDLAMVEKSWWEQPKGNLNQNIFGEINPANSIFKIITNFYHKQNDKN